MSEFLLDNNVYKFITGTENVDVEIPLQVLKESSHEFFTTHIEKNEFQDAHPALQNDLFEVVNTLEEDELPTETFYLDISDPNKAKLDGGEDFQNVRKRLGDGKNEAKDALIIETAIKNDLIFVSDENSHEEVMKNQLEEDFLTKNEFKEDILNE